jgi:hypothetical protein
MNIKKKIFGSIVILAIAGFTAFNVSINTKKNGLSDISLENIEALAGEHPLGDCLYNRWHYCCLLTPTGEECTPLHWAWY